MPVNPPLKPFLSDWDSNLRGWDSKLAKTLHGTPTHVFWFFFFLESLTWYLNLLRLKFLMSHHRKNSVRDKVIGNKWIYLERNTAQRVGPLRR